MELSRENSPVSIINPPDLDRISSLGFNEKSLGLEHFRYTTVSSQSGWMLKRVGSLGFKKPRFCTLEGQQLIISKSPPTKKGSSSTSETTAYALCGAKITGDVTKLLITVQLMDEDWNDKGELLKLYPETESAYEKWLVAFRRLLVAKLEDHYILENRQILGKGAFGSVHVGIDKVSTDKVAIKVIDKAKLDERSIMLTIREHKIARKLSHPKIIKTLDVYDTPNKLYFVMENIPGGTLHDALRQAGQAFTEPQVRFTLRDILSALAYLHDKGIIHRDIKPKNILVRDLDSFPLDLKLVDFGLSNFLASDQGLQSKVGSPLFIAPEIIRKSKCSYNHQVDTWSCGVITYLLLSYKYPFAGKCVADTLHDVVHKELSFDCDVWNNVSEDAKDFVAKLLRKDPVQRLSAEGALKHPFLAL